MLTEQEYKARAAEVCEGCLNRQGEACSLGLDLEEGDVVCPDKRERKAKTKKGK